MNNQKLGDSLWTRAPKINSEIFTLTYGALVQQLLRDFEDVPQVNSQLEKMGYNIGIRLIDELLAKAGISNCSDLRVTADVIAKVGFKMFLGVTAEISQWNEDSKAFSVTLAENPFIDFVELPASMQELRYCNILVGIIKGALEMVQLNVDCRITKDPLKGDDVTELRVELKGVLETVMAAEYNET